MPIGAAAGAAAAAVAQQLEVLAGVSWPCPAAVRRPRRRGQAVAVMVLNGVDCYGPRSTKSQPIEVRVGGPGSPRPRASRRCSPCWPR